MDQELLLRNEYLAAENRILRAKLRLPAQEKGWTQAQMADPVGNGSQYVGEIEQGKRNPCLLNLEIIANGLQISLPKLFSNMKSTEDPRLSGNNKTGEERDGFYPENLT